MSKIPFIDDKLRKDAYRERQKLLDALARGDFPQMANSLAYLLIESERGVFGKYAREALAIFGPEMQPDADTPWAPELFDALSKFIAFAAPELLGAAPSLLGWAPGLLGGLPAALGPALGPAMIVTGLYQYISSEIEKRKHHKEEKHDFLRVRDQILANLTGEQAGAYAPQGPGLLAFLRAQAAAAPAALPPVDVVEEGLGRELGLPAPVKQVPAAAIKLHPLFLRLELAGR